jgi:hypothetical protein
MMAKLTESSFSVTVTGYSIDFFYASLLKFIKISRQYAMETEPQVLFMT